MPIVWHIDPVCWLPRISTQAEIRFSQSGRDKYGSHVKVQTYAELPKIMELWRRTLLLQNKEKIIFSRVLSGVVFVKMKNMRQVNLG